MSARLYRDHPIDVEILAFCSAFSLKICLMPRCPDKKCTFRPPIDISGVFGNHCASGAVETHFVIGIDGVVEVGNPACIRGETAVTSAGRGIGQGVAPLAVNVVYP